jgi:hypothetical protein
MLRSIAVAGAVAVIGVFVLASPAGASAPAAVTAPITLNYVATFKVTPGDPSPCEGVPITDTATGTGSHLGRFTRNGDVQSVEWRSALRALGGLG